MDELSISSVLTESRVTNVVSAASDSASSGADAVLSLPALLPQEADGKLPDATAPDAVNVRVCFDDDNATGFSYDADSGLYRMLHADGTPQLDANNGQQAGFDNLLVLFSASELRDDGKTYDYDLSMGGGVWLNGGHLWYITWTQGTDTTFQFYDADGELLTLNAGRSYLAAGPGQHAAALRRRWPHDEHRSRDELYRSCHQSDRTGADCYQFQRRRDSWISKKTSAFHRAEVFFASSRLPRGAN